LTERKFKQSRLAARFSNGLETSFPNSKVAVALKPSGFAAADDLGDSANRVTDFRTLDDP